MTTCTIPDSREPFSQIVADACRLWYARHSQRVQVDRQAIERMLTNEVVQAAEAQIMKGTPTMLVRLALD